MEYKTKDGRYGHWRLSYIEPKSNTKYDKMIAAEKFNRVERELYLSDSEQYLGTLEQE